MYDDWFLKRNAAFDDRRAPEHELRTIQIERLPRQVHVQCLGEDQLRPWLQNDTRENSMRAVLTLCRLSAIGSSSEFERIKPSDMSVTKHTFQCISEAFQVPPSYLYLRASGNASGAYEKYTQRDESGNIKAIVIVLRVPHAPRNEDKSIWSISLAWDLRMHTTRILFDGLTTEDIVEIEEYCHKNVDDLVHPYAFLVFLVVLLNSYYVKMRQNLEADIVGLEKRLGITRGIESFRGWDWTPETLRSFTQKCYRLTTGPIYLERRLAFLMSLSKFLQDCIHALQGELLHIPMDANVLLTRSRRLVETLENNTHLTSGQSHQVYCLEKRLQNLMTTLNTIVAQIDSRSNLEIARAATYDSSSMLTMAFLTAVFLPPTYVCSLFGMNMFNFEIGDSHRVVSPLFWLYWAITIPLTAIVLVCWGYWRKRRNHNILSKVRVNSFGTV